MDNVTEGRPAPKEIYLNLRSQALHGSRDRWKQFPMVDPAKPWGIVMDWVVQRGICTVLALADGTASLYFSNGGGYIGGQFQETINRAAKDAVGLAADCLSTAELTTNFPLPENGQVFFYLLADKGVFVTNATEQELKAGGHRLLKLANAMQEVIAQYRLKYPKPYALRDLKPISSRETK
jgi:hypothetical protein